MLATCFFHVTPPPPTRYLMALTFCKKFGGVLEVNRAGREASLSPACNAEVKNEWSYTSTSPVRLHACARTKLLVLRCLPIRKQRNVTPLTAVLITQTGCDLLLAVCQVRLLVHS
jgi:hypothetical protein